jgi:hypothetical protein
MRHGRQPDDRRGAGPDPAERARTALTACPLPEVVAHGIGSPAAVHVVEPGGDLVLLVRDDSRLAGIMAGSRGDVAAVLRAAQLRPLQIADRIRARVEVHGRLDVIPPPEHGTAMLRLARRGDVPVTTTLPEGHSLLRLLAGQVLLDGRPVDLAAYRAAEADPFTRRESELLRRLLRDRPDTVAGLCSLLDPALLDGAREIVPSGLDRYGITILVAAGSGTREARIPFAEPVACTTGLEGALRGLLAQARSRRT